MAEPVVLVEKTEGVAILTLNRPEQLNAMNAQLSGELREAVARVTDDDDVGCIVITGAGTRAFSAGGDIHEQREDDRRYTQAELDARNAVRTRGSYEIGACPNATIGMIDGRLHPHITMADPDKAAGGHLEPDTHVLTFLNVALAVLPDDASLARFDDWQWR